MEAIIDINDLDYSYPRGKQVLKALNLTIPRGSIYGFLGPNGAGKSTTMQLITGILEHNDGSIKVMGSPLHEQLPDVFNHIGSLVESPALYLHLTAYDNMRSLCKLKNLEDHTIDPLLELVDLKQHKFTKVKRYSLGMKQRLAIAMALQGEPEILILDEPVNGLDPAGMLEVRKLLNKINLEKGTTIFISSHLLSEIEKLCTHVAIIHQGEIRFEGTMEQLTQQSGKVSLKIKTLEPAEVSEKLQSRYPLLRQLSAHSLDLTLEANDQIPDAIATLLENKISIIEIQRKNQLEEMFNLFTQPTK